MYLRKNDMDEPPRFDEDGDDDDHDHDLDGATAGVEFARFGEIAVGDDGDELVVQRVTQRIAELVHGSQNCWRHAGNCGRG